MMVTEKHFTNLEAVLYTINCLIIFKIETLYLTINCYFLIIKMNIYVKMLKGYVYEHISRYEVFMLQE